MTSRGFTLIEMLISLSVFAVVTAFVTANFRAGRQGDELRISSQLVASVIRRAQTFASAGQTQLICRGGANDLKLCLNGAAECAGGTCAAEIPNGYGIHLTTLAPGNHRAVLFADIDADRAYGDGEAIRMDSVSPGPFVVVQSIDPAVSDALDIVFEPPKPLTLFNGSTADAIATIVVGHSTTTFTKTITVNRISGQINAD